MKESHTHSVESEDLISSEEIVRRRLEHDEVHLEKGATADDSTRLDGQAPSMFATVIAMITTIIPYGGMVATSFSISSTVIGAGIFGLPSAFLSVGMTMGVLYLVAISIETIFSMRLLVLVTQKTGYKTLETMSVALLHPAMGVVVAIVRAVFCFGACIAYVIVVANILTAILNDSDSVPEYWKSTSGIRLLQSMAWLLFMLPLVLPREINSLRYVSAFGISFMVYVVIIIVVHACTDGLKQNPRPAIKQFNTGNDALQGLGVFIFSFVNHFNCLDIYFEMIQRSLRRFVICAMVSISLCCGIYILSGVFGYLDFGPEASGSLLTLYHPIEEPQIFVGYVGVFIKICASYGLLANSCRNAIYHLIKWDPATVKCWKHCIAVITLSVAMLLCGLFIPKVNTVFGFAGGVCGGTIGFVLPALLIMYSGDWNLKSVGIVSYVSTYAVLFGGVVAIVFGTAATIYAAV